MADTKYGKMLLSCRMAHHNTVTVGGGQGRRAREALDSLGCQGILVVEDPAYGRQAFVWSRWEDLGPLGEAMDPEAVTEAAIEAQEDEQN